MTESMNAEIIEFNQEVNRRMVHINDLIDSTMQLRDREPLRDAFMVVVKECNAYTEYIHGFSQEFIQSSKSLLPRSMKALHTNLLSISQRLMETSDIYGDISEFKELTMNILGNTIDIMGKIGLF